MNLSRLLILFLPSVLAGATQLPSLPGDLLLDTRVRYALADEETLDDGRALTTRLRLGWQSPDFHGFTFLIEGEGTAALDGNDYDPYPGAQGANDLAPISDPPNAELNRLQLSWEQAEVHAIIGRQRIIANNGRLLGNSGWRQNEQTFDALRGSFALAREWTIDYAYLDRANRVFGERAEVPIQRRLHLDSHAAWINGRLADGIDIGAYALLLRIQDHEARAMSGDTFGGFVSKEWDVFEKHAVRLRAEYAFQTDNRGSPDGADFNHDYWHLRTGYDFAVFEWSVGWEQLSGDGVFAFSTPLATLHAFNGWADRFGNTPLAGLDDLSIRFSTPVPGEMRITAVWHRFQSETGNIDYGREWDLSVSKKFPHHLTAIAKLARYDADPNAPGRLANDITRISFQLEWRL